MAQSAYLQLIEQNKKDTIKFKGYHSHNQCIHLAPISCYEEGPYLSMLYGLNRSNGWKANFFKT